MEKLPPNDSCVEDLTASGHTRRTMPYYEPPQEPRASTKHTADPVSDTDSHTTQSVSAEPMIVDLAPVTLPHVEQPWVPKIKKISIEEAQAAIENQIRLFNKQPDGSWIREYTAFVAEFNRSLTLFINAGMKLDEIRFEAVRTYSPLSQNLAACKNLQDIADTKTRGVAAKVTLTEDQYQQLKGFYEAIVRIPKKTGQANQEPAVQNMRS